MFEIIGKIIMSYDMIFGICVGAILATMIYFVATYIDHKRMVEIAKKRVYDSMDLLFSGSYWDQKIALEIILPEVM